MFIYSSIPYNYNMPNNPDQALKYRIKGTLVQKKSDNLYLPVQGAQPMEQGQEESTADDR